jgi:hypothetical protein
MPEGDHGNARDSEACDDFLVFSESQIFDESKDMY